MLRSNKTWPTAIEAVASGEGDLDVLATDHHGLDDAETPLSRRPAPTTLKSMVHPGRRPLTRTLGPGA